MKSGKFLTAVPSRHGRIGFLFLLPALVVLLIVAFIPLVNVIYLSFTNQELFSLQSESFVGCANYTKIFNDPLFFVAIWNTLAFVLISVSLETALGVLFACLMHYQHPLRGFLRAIILIPWAIPTMISTKIWEWMLSDVGGVVNYFLIKLGIVDQPVLLSSHPTWALLTVALVDVWKTTPFVALIVLAGLQIIPQDCADAARIDGISPVRFFFRVTLPMLRNTIIVAVVLRLIESMRVFDVIYGLVGDNPATLSMAVYIRQQMFSFQSMGLSSAAASILLLLVGAVILVLLRLQNRKRMV